MDFFEQIGGLAVQYWPQGGFAGSIGMAVTMGYKWLDRHEDGKRTSTVRKAIFFGSLISSFVCAGMAVIQARRVVSPSVSAPAQVKLADVAHQAPPGAAAPVKPPPVIKAPSPVITKQRHTAKPPVKKTDEKTDMDPKDPGCQIMESYIDPASGFTRLRKVPC